MRIFKILFIFLLLSVVVTAAAHAVFISKDLIKKVDLDLGFKITICPINDNTNENNLLDTSPASDDLDNAFLAKYASACTGPEESIIYGLVNYQLQKSTSGKKLYDNYIVFGDKLYRLDHGVLVGEGESQGTSFEDEIGTTKYTIFKEIYNIDPALARGGQQKVEHSGLINYTPQNTNQEELKAAQAELPSYPGSIKVSKDQLPPCSQSTQGQPFCNETTQAFYIKGTSEDVVSSGYKTQLTTAQWQCLDLNTLTEVFEAGKVLSCKKGNIGLFVNIITAGEKTYVLPSFSGNSVQSIFIFMGKTYKFLHTDAIVQNKTLLEYPENKDYTVKNPDLSAEISNFPVFKAAAFVNKLEVKDCGQERDSESNLCSATNYLWQTTSTSQEVINWYQKETKKAGWNCTQFESQQQDAGYGRCYRDNLEYILDVSTISDTFVQIKLGVPLTASLEDQKVRLNGFPVPGDVKSIKKSEPIPNCVDDYLYTNCNSTEYTWITKGSVDNVRSWYAKNLQYAGWKCDFPDYEQYYELRCGKDQLKYKYAFGFDEQYLSPGNTEIILYVPDENKALGKPIAKPLPENEYKDLPAYSGSTFIDSKDNSPCDGLADYIDCGSTFKNWSSSDSVENVVNFYTKPTFPSSWKCNTDGSSSFSKNNPTVHVFCTKNDFHIDMELTKNDSGTLNILWLVKYPHLLS